MEFTNYDLRLTRAGRRQSRVLDAPGATNRKSAIANRKWGGFTLLELLTVIAIMGILAAISLPAVRSLKPNAKVAGTRQLLDAVNHARQLALAQRTTVYMVFLYTNFYTGLSAADLDKVQPLLDKQLTGYAYLTLRSVGDQPGQSNPRYLSSWKTLPAGSYIPFAKFWAPSVPINFTNMADGRLDVFRMYNFSTTNTATVSNPSSGFPFPSEESLLTVATTLPYIAFDGMGQLVSGMAGQPEVIPVVEGNLAFARNVNTKETLPQPPTVNEQPPGNLADNLSMVYIDRLTGRARVERRKVQ